MPQIKSQAKRVLTNAKRTQISKSKKTSLKNSIKKVNLAVANNDYDAAKEALSVVYKKLDASVTSGIHHKNYAARHKARLSKVVNNISKVDS